MKRLLYLAALMTVSSCSMATWTLNYDSRTPSVSGLDIAGENVKVVYLYSGTDVDSLASANVAAGFAEELQEAIGTTVKTEARKKDPEKEFSPKDEAVAMVLASDTDAVFFIDNFDGKIYCYDSMTKDDEIYSASLNSIGTTKEAGKAIAEYFVPQWKVASLSFYYLEDSDKWLTALQRCHEFRFDDAITLWMDIVRSSAHPALKACAEYNIAAACYMLQRYDIALEWLDMSDKTSKQTLSSGLRTRINLKKQ